VCATFGFQRTSCIAIFEHKEILESADADEHNDGH
jgi:hypothetical protein